MSAGGVRLERLDHVSLNVRDRHESIAWYRDVLGLAQQNPPGRDDWPVFMGQFGACIALFQAELESPEREREFSVGGLELAQAQAHLRALGVDFRFEDHGNAHSLYVADPDGNVIELTSSKALTSSV